MSAIASLQRLARRDVIVDVSSRSSRSRRSSIRQPFRVSVVSRAAVDEEFRKSVDGLQEPCDDFVCKSSPAVENTLKTLVKDINACRGTTRSIKPYAPDVTYDDGALRFTGSEKYKKYCSYVENNLRQVTTRVTEISMKDSLDVATVRWELNGVNDIGRVGVDVTTTFKMNLITGRVMEHRETWKVNAARTEAQAGALLESTRKAHALPLNMMELADKASKSINEISKSFASQDDGDRSNIYADPNDPMKFFQQEDTSKTDLLQFALAASVIFLCTKVFELLN